MGGCEYAPMSGSWWGGFFPGSFLPLLVLGLVIFLIVCLSIWILKPRPNGLRGASQDRIDSQAILKARFARGEISREDFIKMKEIISQP